MIEQFFEVESGGQKVLAFCVGLLMIAISSNALPKLTPNLFTPTGHIKVRHRDAFGVLTFSFMMLLFAFIDLTRNPDSSVFVRGVLMFLLLPLILNAFVFRMPPVTRPDRRTKAVFQAVQSRLAGYILGAYLVLVGVFGWMSF